jgi:hypothetical protein
MKRLLAIPVAMAVACGGSSGSFQDNAAASLPNKSSVAMNTPGGATSAKYTSPSAALTEGGDASRDATTNDPFFALTVGVAVTFNVPVAAFLDLISSIANTPPTSCTATVCTWGPGHSTFDFNNYELTVSQDADGTSFDWALSAQPLSKPTAPFVQIAGGVAKPSGEAHHGSGSFSMDFDAANTLDGPHSGQGKLNVTSYNNVGPASLAVTFTGAQDSTVTSQLNNIAYSYAADSTGGGDLQFALKNTTTLNNFSVHSRWKNDGSGRADIQGTDVADSPANPYVLQDSDCWGAAPFTQEYFTSSIKVNAPPFASSTTVGVETSCAFSPAVFSTLTVQ